MNTTTHPLIDVVRILVLLQAGILIVSMLEASVAMLAFGPAGMGLILINGLLVATMLVLSNRLGRRSNRARRLLRFIEVMIVIWAVFDLALAMGLAGRSIELVSIATRIVLPAYVLQTLRRTDVKASFQSVEASQQPSSTLTGAAA